MINNSHPLVSVIMPAYNGVRFIAAAIRSVLQQSYTEWELLVIDDASTDDTPAIIQRFKDSRIIYCRTDHIGSPAGVRNVGLRQAKGEFIAFLDADDLYYPDALEKLATVLLENPRYTAVHGFQTFIDENDHLLQPNISLIPLDSGRYVLPPTYTNSWENILNGYIISTLPSLMLRRSTLERIGLFNESLYGPEDYEFYIRLFLDNYDAVCCLPAYIYHYRIHAESLTKSPKHIEKLLTSHVRIMDWLFRHPKLPSELRRFKSKAYLEGYHYLARERLIYNQPALARQIAFSALKNPNIHLIDWLSRSMQIILRSYLPSSLNARLMKFRYDWQNYLLLTPFIRPLRGNSVN